MIACNKCYWANDTFHDRSKVFHNLIILRERVTFEVNVTFINKIVARILNFFEKNRTQLMIFLNVQKNNIIIRYVLLWNDIIRFLLNLLINNDICSILFIRYLKLLTKLNDSFITTKQFVEALHVINSKQLNFQKCFWTFSILMRIRISKISTQNFQNHCDCMQQNYCKRLKYFSLFWYNIVESNFFQQFCHRIRRFAHFDREKNLNTR